jgi:MFS family permease
LAARTGSATEPSIIDIGIIDIGIIAMDKSGNTSSISPPMIRSGNAIMALVPIMGVVFIAFLIIGIAMPVLPLHVHQRLGLSTFVVGLVAGSQFAASLISRPLAGRHADMRGAKNAVVTGLIAAALAGLLYLLSLQFVGTPLLSVTILLLGRALLGAGESFIITGAQAWGLVISGPKNTGAVLAWMGTALYAAFALGAPVGAALYATHGFFAIALATTSMPLVTLVCVALLRHTAPIAHARTGFRQVIAAVALPGLGLAFSSTGFGATTAFVALLFAARGWTVWPAFTAFAVTFMAARVCLGHLADRVGGAQVALVCVLIEAAGQAFLWLAPSSAIALIGAAITGFGFSLVYPGFGVEAVRRAPPQSAGLAMGAYTAFLDVTLALTSPVLGFIAGGAGLPTVFLVSALSVLCAAAIAVRLIYAARAQMPAAYATCEG